MDSLKRMVIFDVKFFLAANMWIKYLTWRAVSRCVLRCATSSVYCLLHPEEASRRNADVINLLSAKQITYSAKFATS